MKSAVVQLPGLNRDRDMIAALTRISGKAPVTIWQTETDIPDVDLIVIPGGFSYGDYLRCGAMAAQSPVMAEVKRRADETAADCANCCTTASRLRSAKEIASSKPVESLMARPLQRCSSPALPAFAPWVPPQTKYPTN